MTDDRHLGLLDLDAVRAREPLSASQRAHLAWCPTCQAALADLEVVAAELAAGPAAVHVSPEREAAILAIANQRAELGRSAPRARPRLTLAGRWAAAAVLALAVGVMVLSQRRSLDQSQFAAAPAARPTLTVAQADLNGDGRVDVLDAFALARAVTRGTPQVGDADRHDVDLILAMAVSLDGVENE